MKKLLTFLTVLSLSLSLCCCTQKNVQSTQIESSAPEPVTESVKEKTFSSGKIQNNVYYSDFSELTITAPNDKWEFADRNYLLSLLGIDETAEESQKNDEEIAKKATIYDSLLSDNATGSNILIKYENLSVVSNPEISEIEFAKNVGAELKSSKTYKYEVADPYTVVISAKKYIRLDCSTKIERDDVHISYFIRKTDKYMLVICVTPGVTGDVAVENMLSFIS